MGIRGELFSTRVSCEGRTYFFNVKQNRMGDVFLSIVESKPTEPETFDRRSIVVFGSDVKPFIKAFQTALSFMEKPKEASRPLSFHPADPMPPRKIQKRVKIGGAEAGEARDESGQNPAAANPEASHGAGAKAGISVPSPLAGALPEKKRRIVVKRAKPKTGNPGENQEKTETGEGD